MFIVYIYVYTYKYIYITVYMLHMITKIRNASTGNGNTKDFGPLKSHMGGENKNKTNWNTYVVINTVYVGPFLAYLS